MSAASEENEFRIEGVTPTHPSVEAWSTSRLPFEPKKVAARPWLPAFRSQLRDVLAGLIATEGEMLVAEFATDERHLFDVENVLLYNVGLDAFRSSGRDGVRFQRRDWESAPQGLKGAHCYQRYVTTAAATGVAQPSGVVLASWSSVACDAFAREATASVAWLTCAPPTPKYSAPHVQVPASRFG